MAGLAFLLKARGFRVSGCDLSVNRLADWLAGHGIGVTSGHSAEHLAHGVDWVVRSAAVPLECEELRAASGSGIPVFARGQVLPCLLAGHRSIAVSGTHGKTTTCTFIAQLLKASGRDVSWCIGGECPELGAVAGAGREPGSPLVVEADESDGTVALYHPQVAVVTNVEFDHMEHFESREAFESCFRRFIGNSEKVIFCGEDPGVSAMARGLANVVSYGLSEHCDLRGRELRATASALELTLEQSGRALGRVKIPVAGEHNALNALGAAAAAFEMGLDFAEIAGGLGRLSLPRRRFERVAEGGGILVISDYAHHPSEIAALVRTAARLDAGRLVALFQPHRFTRTRALGPGFPAAFEGVQQLILAPVYAASETQINGGSSWDLYEQFRRRAGVGMEVLAAGSLAEAWGYLKGDLRAGDVFMIVGAGDVEQVAAWANDFLVSTVPARAGGTDLAADVPLSPASTVRVDEPLGEKTTLRAGGRADVWAEIATEQDLRALLAWTHDRGERCHIVGAGSNLLVSDLGVGGVVGRLAGREFLGLREEDDMVVAGAGVAVAGLLRRLHDRGREGLEFLHGIPGTLGGALRMNAGAWNDAVGNHVSWIRCLNPDGSECIVDGPSLGFGYRACRALETRVAVEAGLRVVAGDRERIREKLAAIEERRRWMKGLRCAGSVFRNPQGDAAGRLIERAGLKGLAVGDASVSPQHGNVIVTRDGARASDVLALIEKVRGEVASQFGVELELEIELLGRR